MYVGDIVMIDAIGASLEKWYAWRNDEENLGERSDVTQTASKSGHQTEQCINKYCFRSGKSGGKGKSHTQ